MDDGRMEASIMKCCGPGDARNHDDDHHDDECD